MAVYLSLFAGAGQQFFTNAGVPLAGGKIYTYGAGGSTPQATYTTSAGNIAHSNPIVLDAAGRVPGGGEIWLTDTQVYKFVLETSAGATVQTLDNVSAGIGSAALVGSSGSSLIGFIQDQSGAVATTVQSVLRRTVWVEDFLPANFNYAVDDATTYIQAAINSNAAVINFANKTYRITSPIYMDSAKHLVGQGAAETTILKITSTVGTGSNLAPGRSGLITDSYAQNAIIILRHPNDAYNEQSSIKGITLSASGYIVTYGIFAPRTSKLWLSDVYIYQCQTGFLTYDSWLTKFDKVIADSNSQKAINGGPTYGYPGVTVGIQWANDSSGLGTGTSLDASNCWARDCDFGWYFYGISYSNLNACASDNISNTAYFFQLSRINMNGCGLENVQILNNGAIYCDFSSVSMNGCDSFQVYGAALGTTSFLFIEGGKVTLNSSRFNNFTIANASYNLIIQNGGTLVNNNSVLPANGNSFVTYNGGSQQVNTGNVPPVVISEASDRVARFVQGRVRDNEVSEKVSKSIASGGTVIATLTSAGGALDYAVCEFTVSWSDPVFATGAGISKFFVAVMKEGVNYRQDISTPITAYATNGGAGAPAYTLSRVGNVWSLTITPQDGACTAHTITAEFQNINGVTLALP